MHPLLNQYLANLPQLHTWDEGKTWNTGGFNAQQLQAIYSYLMSQGESLSFIETGAGNSTLLFSFLAPARIISIDPNPALFERIRQQMRIYNLDVDKVVFIADYSEWALPRLVEGYRIAPIFDVALIDGDHNYPNVFIDFFYLNYGLKAGGIIMVDDTQIYSCRELSLFLLHEPDFELVLDLGKIKLFKRHSDRRVLRGWDSGYNLKMTNTLTN
ncbi:MAG: class I SAM-dependent methyltransferase [Pseudanabaenaceae cyanobacterium]